MSRIGSLVGVDREFLSIPARDWYWAVPVFHGNLKRTQISAE